VDHLERVCRESGGAHRDSAERSVVTEGRGVESRVAERLVIPNVGAWNKLWLESLCYRRQEGADTLCCRRSESLGKMQLLERSMLENIELDAVEEILCNRMLAHRTVALEGRLSTSPELSA